ncbi:hypothetical protein [Variovorax sp. RA8]|uniref:hypothetical protein n=1 Tax=Variovorax sp. (strain JCM 16519 / RA8) TaxID=662548 RepID=UPI000B033879|nr:hypothetical protein [Variovorax sp. RA8]VTU35482.1 hypothetical protein RA8CHR_05229 [Variovorax sp. RA8]
MKRFFKWSAIVVSALIALAFLHHSPALTKYFVVLTGIVVYCFWQLSKQIQANHEAMVRRTDVLFKLARGSAGLDKEDL